MIHIKFFLIGLALLLVSAVTVALAVGIVLGLAWLLGTWFGWVLLGLGVVAFVYFIGRISNV